MWNGENYELSFKLHLCGGNLVQVPCSHVAHTTKHRTAYKEENYGVDYSAKNLKRVAEVWMDEFKEALYATEPEKYKLDPGDLTKALLLKRTLNCKPFKYFLEVIAPDLSERFPPFKEPDFASGAVMFEANSSLCMTFDGNHLHDPLKLRPCSENLTHPEDNQSFALSWFRFIIHQPSKNLICLDSDAVNFYECHFDFGNQFWKYDLVR